MSVLIIWNAVDETVEECCIFIDRMRLFLLRYKYLSDISHADINMTFKYSFWGSIFHRIQNAKHLARTQGDERRSDAANKNFLIFKILKI